MKTSLPSVSVGLIKKYTICFFGPLVFLFLSMNMAGQTVTTGKSYINITRPGGGTFAPGDIIEVRATIAVSGGSSGSPVSQLRYNDTVNLTKFNYVAGSLKMINNEGRTQAAYTDADNDDKATINTVATPGLGYIRFVIGNGSTTARYSHGNSATNTGSLWGALFPTFFGGTCIQVFAYQLQVKNVPAIVDYDSTINLYSGNFRYTLSGSRITSFPRYIIKVFQDYGLCSNAIGTNALVSEFGGTFGSGHNRNRTTSSALVPLPYTMKMFTTNTPNDNYYGIASNTSGSWGTDPNISQPNAIRVFSVWDIIGDHTGAASLTAGNPPADTTIAGSTAGYALIINASYETNQAFEQTITNLCEDTYYEFSAWFRNICRRCGCDSSGKGTGSTGYVPGSINPILGTPDSAGVRPNLTFKIDSFDYYTTGNMPYSGEWVKKGFIYRTKPGQTSFTISIRNNAPGGGGNDWAIDDIGVATCTPNMKYSPSLTPNICNNNALTIYDTVRSFFDNYVYYQWQKSTDGGATWINVGAPTGAVTPVWNGTAWEYVAAYTVPPTETYPANSGDKYRVIVGTSLTNLTDFNCRSTDVTNTVTLNVLICGPILNVNLVSFSGKTADRKVTLKWTTTAENEQLYFDVEKSTNGSDFTDIATINSYNNTSSEYNQYSFTDPSDLMGKTFYRVRMRTMDNHTTYSRILEMTTDSKAFSFGSVINPFSNTLYFDISSVKSGQVNTELINQFGVPVRKKVLDLREGINQFSFDNTGALAPGMYILKAELDGIVIYKKVMKQVQ